jgi:hypothetical protein
MGCGRHKFSFDEKCLCDRNNEIKKSGCYMPTINDIRDQIETYGQSYIFWTNREIKQLPEILDDSEMVKAVTSGIVGSSTWLAVCTDRRMIFLNCNMFIGLQQVQMPLDRVQSLDHEFGLVFGTIKVFDGISRFELNMILRSSIMPFVKATEAAMHAFKSGPSRGKASPPTDVASQLEKLVELKEKGYLTDAEFQTQKAKILGS